MLLQKHQIPKLWPSVGAGMDMLVRGTLLLFAHPGVPIHPLRPLPSWTLPSGESHTRDK